MQVGPSLISNSNYDASKNTSAPSNLAGGSQPASLPPSPNPASANDGGNTEGTGERLTRKTDWPLPENLFFRASSLSSTPATRGEMCGPAPAAPAPMPEGTIRPIGDVEGFFIFNPVGRFVKGAAGAAADILTAPAKTVIGVARLAQDGAGYALNALSPKRSVVTGEVLPYEPRSGLIQSIQQNGVGGTAGAVLDGAIQNAPGLGLIRALYQPNRDWADIGAQTVNTGVALKGAVELRKATMAPEGVPKFAFDDSLNAVDRTFAKQAGEIIAKDPVAAASYARLQREGTEVRFVNDPKIPQAGLFDRFKNTVTVNMLRHASPREAVSTIVHEATHQNRAYTNGVGANTLYEEYLAYRNEELFRTGTRPTLAQRQEIINWIQKVPDYNDIEAGPLPTFGRTMP